MSKVFITGPAAVPESEAMEAFTAAHLWLEAQGHEVMNPYVFTAQMPQYVPGWSLMTEGHQARQIVNQRIQQLPFCEDLFVLDGWEADQQASLEVHIALNIGMDVRFQSGVNHG